MKINLTSIQRKVLTEALSKGFLTLGDMYMAYSTNKSRLEALERFKMAGIISDSSSGTNRYIINKSKLKEILEE